MLPSWPDILLGGELPGSAHRRKPALEDILLPEDRNHRLVRRGARRAAPAGSAPPSFDDLESAIRRIPGVAAARAEVGDDGAVAALHVIATADLPVSSYERDIQTVASAVLGFPLPAESLRVVRLTGDTDTPAPEPEDPPRPAGLTLRMVHADDRGVSARVLVRLAAGNLEIEGRARGPASATTKLIARAVVDAVCSLDDELGLDLEQADILTGGPHAIAVVAVRCGTPVGDQIETGSAAVVGGPHDAVARAALRAINRHLGAADTTA